MKIIILGGSSYIAKNIIKRINKNNSVICCIRNLKKEDKIENVEYIEGDINDIHFNFLKDADIVYNFIWMGSYGINKSSITTQLMNINLTKKIIDLCISNNVKKIVNFGTIAQYEGKNNELYQDKNNSYKITKLFNHHFINLYTEEKNIISINIVLTNVWGGEDHSKRFLNKILFDLLNNRDIKLSSCHQYYDFVYIEDAIKQILLISESNTNITKIIGSGFKPMRLKKIILIIKKITGSSSKIIFDQKEPPSVNKHFLYQNFFMKSKFNITHFSDKIIFYINWLEENNYEK